MATISAENHRLVIRGEPHERKAALQIFGSGPRKDGSVTMPLNVMSWYEVEDLFAPTVHEYDSSADEWRAEEVKLTKLGRLINDQDLEVWGLPDLHEWQNQAQVRGGSAVVAVDRGMGKTRFAVEAIRRSVLATERPSLVVTPMRLRSVWLADSERWWRSGVAFAPRGERWSDVADEIGSKPITVLTYDSLLNQDVRDAIGRLDIEWLVVDEAHNLKRRDRHNVTKDAEGVVTEKRLSKSGALRSINARNRLALTGSPMPNVWHEIWTLLNFVAPKVFTSYWQFVEIIGRVKESFWGGKEIDKKIHRPEIWEEVFDRWIIRADRPESGKVWDFVPVELGKEEASAYKSMAKTMRVEQDGQRLEASNALAQAVRLQQLAGGLGEWTTKEDSTGKIVSKYRHALPSAKLDMLLGMLDGLQRAVVFTRYRDRAEFVADHLDCGVLFTGGQSEKVTTQRLEWFRDVEQYPSPQVAICVYGTISEGVNDLVSAHDIFFLDWTTAKDVTQAADRLDRPGQTSLVRCVTLYAKGTIDEVAIDREAGKVRPLREILRSPDAWRFLDDPLR